MKRKFLLVIFIIIFLSGCAPTEPETTAPVESTNTPVVEPTSTLEPTPTPTTIPTDTPEPTATPLPTPTPFPAGKEVISPENASQIELLDWLTFGGINFGADVENNGEKIGFSIATSTHLIGYSSDGEIRYKLLTPICASASFACLETENNYALDIFDLALGEVVQRLDHLVNFPSSKFIQYEWEDSNILKVQLNADGSQLAVVYADNMISLWDTNTGIEYSLPRTFENAYQIAFSSDGKFFAVTANFWEGNITLFDISDLSDIQLVLSQNNVGHLVSQPFSVDNRFLLTAEPFASNPKYAYFDLEKMEMVERAAMPDGASARFSADGEYIIFDIVFSELGGGTEMIDLETGERVKDQALIDSILMENEADIVAAYVQFFEDNTMSLSDIMSINTSEYEFDRGPYFPAASLYPSVMLFPYEDTAAVWSVGSYTFGMDWSIDFQRWLNGEVIQVPIQLGDVPAESNVFINFSNLAQYQDLIFYCLNGELVQQLVSVDSEPVPIAQNCAEPYVVAYDPVNNLVAYPADARNVEVVDIDTGEVKFQLNGYSNPLGKLKFSGDGNWIMLLGARPDDNSLDELMLFSLDHESGEANAVPLDLNSRRYQEFILDVDLAENGSYLVAGVGKLSPALSEIHIWDFTGQGAGKRTIYTGWPNYVDLSPDNSLIAIAELSTAIKLYSVETSELLAEFSTPMNEQIRAIMFSEDGKSLFVVFGSAVSVWGVP